MTTIDDTLLTASFDHAVAQFRTGNLTEAERCYCEILVAHPGHPRALQGLGIVRFQSGAANEGVQLLKEAVTNAPEYADGWTNLGQMLKIQGRFGEARDAYERAAALAPDVCAIRYNLGWLLLKEGKHVAAIMELTKALELRSDYADAAFLLGVTLGSAGDHGGAVDAFALAVKSRPDHAEAWCNLGFQQAETGQLHEAQQSLLRALRINPTLAESWNNLGNVLVFQGRIRSALYVFRKAFMASKAFGIAMSNRLLAMQYLPSVTGKDLLDESRSLAAMLPAVEPSGTDGWRVTPHPERRLKIGIVSGDLHSHPVAFFLLPFLEAHDRSQYEITCYADVAVSDRVTALIRSYADRWVESERLANGELAQRIRAEQIDILIDLAGHTGGSRLPLFKAKPAPIQVTWLGYPGTTGLEEIDYRLADAISDPPGDSDRHHAERLYRLTDGFLCYASPDNAPDPGYSPISDNGLVTFGCFNNYPKINDDLLRLWGQILNRVPGARLYLKNRSLGDSAVKEGLIKRFARIDGEPERLILAGQTPTFTEHLAQYRMVDIALDTFPYNGTTTTCEALWMGVPVVTLAGNRHASRVGASILSRVGLKHWIAVTPEQYVESAVKLATDQEGLESLRTTLRSRMADSPLCNGTAFARELETALRTMWRQWCEKQGKVARGAVSSHLESHRTGLDSLNSGDYPDAEARFRVALSLDSQFAPAWNDLGIAVSRQGRREEALEHFRMAVALDPDFAKAWSNLGNVLLECNCFKEAIEVCETALRIDPHMLEARQNLGIAFISMGRHKDALACLFKATKLAPNVSAAWALAGDACREAGRLSQAASCYRRAWTLDPLDSNNAGLLARLCDVLLGIGDHFGAARQMAKALATESGDAGVRSSLLMASNYLPETTQEFLADEARKWGELFGAGLPWLSPLEAKRGERLRIGYVSADLHRHPVGTLLRPALLFRNRDSFEVYCYSNSHREDELTAELKGVVDGWRVIAGMSDQNAAELIRRDGIDILVDLSGHTAGNRLTLFARRPAPVQVSWLGYCHTTGMSTVDYLLSDSDTTLPGEEHLYTEQVIRLPNSRFCYMAPSFVPDVDPLPALENGFITFGSFNNLSKVNEQVVALWGEVLRAVPDSRLILKWKSLESGVVRQRFRKMFLRQGVDPRRIEFRGGSPHFLMLTEYGDVDIALDPFPFTGGLTTCEALWMGVPVVTLRGSTPISRQTASILKQVGLTDWIADSPDELVAAVTKHASSPADLARLRLGLRERMAASPFCDGPRFSADLEAIFRQIWKQTTMREHSPGEIDSLLTAVAEGAQDLYAKARYGQAEDVYRDILRWASEHPQALHGLGMTFFKRGNSREGIPFLEKAIDFKPDYEEAYFNLAGMLKSLDRLDEAEQRFRQALALNPKNAAALSNLAGVLWTQGRAAAAVELFRQALARRPGFGPAVTGLLLSFNYVSGTTSEEVLTEHRAWGTTFERDIKPCRRWLTLPDPEKRLRIGYVSSDLGHHPVGYFMVNPITHRHRDRIEVFCYSNRNGDDDLTRYFREHSDCWRQIHGLSDDEVAKLVRQDRIDILVDLSGHTGGSRMGLFARQPAPVQVSWLGYPNTTGLTRITYRLTDAVADPPGRSDELHTERLVRLPSGFLCFFPPPDSPEVSKLPAAQTGQLTFGSFNNLAKVTPEVVAVWSRILVAMPKARLIIKRSSFRDAATRNRYLAMFAAHGVSEDCLELLPSTETHAEHLKIYNVVDVALDTFPYNGTTTTCEALWMGVPVITLKGESHVGRVGASILTRIGLDDYVAADADAYVAKAVALADDIEGLALTRELLRNRMASSPLCNGPAFCTTLENAYREMWQTWCRSVGSAQRPLGLHKTRQRGPRRLHIGGTRKKKGWEIFNAVPGEHVDHLGDAADLSRFPDGTFTEIYASHVLEHFDYQRQLPLVLKEWFRVLVPGGTLSLSVPDLDALVDMWHARDNYTADDRFFIMQMMFGGHVDAYDYHFAGFNEEILSRYLAEAGFVDVRRLEGFNLFRDTSCMRYKGRLVSVNLMTRKPLW